MNLHIFFPRNFKLFFCTVIEQGLNTQIDYQISIKSDFIGKKLSKNDPCEVGSDVRVFYMTAMQLIKLSRTFQSGPFISTK